MLLIEWSYCSFLGNWRNRKSLIGTFKILLQPNEIGESTFYSPIFRALYIVLNVRGFENVVGHSLRVVPNFDGKGFLLNVGKYIELWYLRFLFELKWLVQRWVNGVWEWCAVLLFFRTLRFIRMTSLILLRFLFALHLFVVFFSALHFNLFFFFFIFLLLLLFLLFTSSLTFELFEFPHHNFEFAHRPQVEIQLFIRMMDHIILELFGIVTLV